MINTEKEYQAACRKLDEFLEKYTAEPDHLSTEADKEFRLLSLAMIRKLRIMLGCTADSLIET